MQRIYQYSHFQTEIIEIPSNSPIVSGSCSSNTVIVLLENGECYESIISNENNSKTNQFKLISNHVFKQCYCGEKFIIFIDNDDIMYIYGYCFNEKYTSPTPFLDEGKIALVNVNKSKIVIVKKESNDIIIWQDAMKSKDKKAEIKGFCRNDQKIKKIGINDKYVVVLLENGFAFKIDDELMINPILVQSRIMYGGNKFLDIDCIKDYMVLITSKKEVFIEGKLVDYVSRKSSLPIFTNNPTNVFALENFCVIIDLYFGSYSFGKNIFGAMPIFQQSTADSSYHLIKTSCDFPIKCTFGTEQVTYIIPLEITQNLIQKFVLKDILDYHKDKILSHKLFLQDEVFNNIIENETTNDKNINENDIDTNINENNNDNNKNNNDNENTENSDIELAMDFDFV